MSREKIKGCWTASLILAAIFIAGSYIRLLPWQNFVTRDGIYFLEADNYEHLRKITIIFNNFPNIPHIDYYTGFPVGTGNLTSPLFDLTIAAVLKLILGFYNGPNGIELFTVFIPPFLGMLAIIPLFLWARESFGAGTALVSALIFSILPAHIFTTLVGRPDNELMEPLWAALTFYLYARLCGVSEDADRPVKKMYIIAALTGLSAAISLLYWRGSVIWWGIMAAHCLWMVLFTKDDLKRERFWLSGTVAYGTIALIIAAVCLTNLWGLQSRTKFNMISWFHVIIALMAVASFSTARLFRHLIKKSSFGPLKAAGLALTFFALCAAALFALRPQVFLGLLEGAAVIGGGNKWTQTIAQYKPFLTDDSGSFSVMTPLRISAAFIFLSPLVLAFLSIPSRIKKSPASYGFFVFAGWCLFIITITNGRYENVYSLFAAVCGAIFITGIFRAIAGRLKSYAGAGIGAAAALAAAFVLTVPATPFYKGIAHSMPFMIRGDLEDTLLWIRESTPATSNFLDPDKRPEYGVLARWEFGGWVEYVARRPAIATGFGTETHGMKESAEFFLATDEREFLDILDENSVRYFILSKTLGALPEYADILGRDPSGYLRNRAGEDGRPVWETGEKFFDLVQTSLYMNDGQESSVPINFRGVSGVRLVYESPSASDVRGFSGEVKQFKVFERVKGAVITGLARPGEKVVLAGTVLTNQGRSFLTVREATADGTGRFSITAWYPTVEQGDYRTGVTGAYLLKVGGASKGLKISEEDVVEGRALELGG